MKFVFLIMGEAFDSADDRASIHGGMCSIIGVRDIEDACRIASGLEDAGCIELCGAFGPEGAERIIEATGNRIPIGYVTHLPRQDDIFRAAFG